MPEGNLAAEFSDPQQQRMVEGRACSELIGQMHPPVLRGRPEAWRTHAGNPLLKPAGRGGSC